MNIKKEVPIWLIILFPLAYLAFVWNGLPAEVPMQYSTSGAVNRWGSKNELLFLSFLMPFVSYLLFCLIPIIDPKKKIAKMGNKFYQLKFVFVSIMSLLAFVVIYVAKHPDLASSGFQLIVLVVGLLFVVLGNYFQSIAPNYFLGIRTPWTLESPEVWKLTHRLAGKLWMIGGLAIIVLGFTWNGNQDLLHTVFLSIIVIITLIPVVYSFIKFKQLSSGAS